MQDAYASFFRGKILRTVLTVSVVGGIYGAVSVFFPDVTGSGMHFISGWIMTSSSLGLLAAVLLARFIGILLCFCSGIPGGIFAPSLSVGALIGAVMGMGMLHLGILNYDPGILAIVGMSAFFAASVRAPITGIILICEMTNNFQFLLPMMIAVVAATQTASLLKGRPLYTQILERTLRLSGNEEKIEEYRVFKKENNVD
jgi:CIC family chloride channel protein